MSSYKKLGWPSYQDLSLSTEISVTEMKLFPYEHFSTEQRRNFLDKIASLSQHINRAAKMAGIIFVLYVSPTDFVDKN